MHPSFRLLDPAVPPASDLIAAVLAEYDVAAGRRLQGGPSARAADFSPPGGAYVVGFVGDVPVCGGGIKDLGSGAAELKRMYVTPPFRGHAIAQALLGVLEGTARRMGYRYVRLDSKASTWPIYLAAGYAQLPDYNGNPHADFWGETPLNGSSGLPSVASGPSDLRRRPSPFNLLHRGVVVAMCAERQQLQTLGARRERAERARGHPDRIQGAHVDHLFAELDAS